MILCSGAMKTERIGRNSTMEHNELLQQFMKYYLPEPPGEFPIGDEIIDIMNQHIDMFKQYLPSDYIPRCVLSRTSVAAIKRLSPEFGYPWHRIINDAELLCRICINDKLGIKTVRECQEQITKFDLWPKVVSWFEDPEALYNEFKQYFSIADLARNAHVSDTLAETLLEQQSGLTFVCWNMSIDFMMKNKHRATFDRIERHHAMTPEIYFRFNKKAVPELLRHPRIRCLDFMDPRFSWEPVFDLIYNPNITPEFINVALYTDRIHNIFRWLRIPMHTTPSDAYEIYPHLY